MKAERKEGLDSMYLAVPVRRISPKSFISMVFL